MANKITKNIVTEARRLRSTWAKTQRELGKVVDIEAIEREVANFFNVDFYLLHKKMKKYTLK